MISQIAITFGSEKILRAIIAKNPDRSLYLYSSQDDSGKLMLLDASGSKSIFNSPVIYDVLGYAGNDKWNGFVNLTTIALDSDQQKIFDAKINQVMAASLPDGMGSIYSMNYHKDINQRVLLTTWDNFDSYSVWQESIALSQKYRNSPSFYMSNSSFVPAKDKKDNK